MMKVKGFLICGSLLLCTAALAGDFRAVPVGWKWISEREVAFTYDGSYTDSAAFSLSVPGFSRKDGIKAPGRYESFPGLPEGAQNPTWAPDSSRFAFTLGGNLYVQEAASGVCTPLSEDGSQLVLNGYASWVYYEEIFGRASNYRAFWWAPDSRHIAFYRFDDTQVPEFPIYSPKGTHGELRLTRYPQAGDPNPAVRIGIVDLCSGEPSTVWASFDASEDCCYGLPFWGPSSDRLYVQKEPRLQNTLELFEVSAADGAVREVYREFYPTWLEWMDDMLFTSDGLYMARDFETLFQQIYYLSYDGKTLRRLSEGENRGIRLLRVDSRKGLLYFTARRDYSYKNALYELRISDGRVLALTDPSLNVTGVSFSPDCRYFAASLSGFKTPTQVWVYETARAHQAWTSLRQSRGAAARGAAGLSGSLPSSRGSYRPAVDPRVFRTCTKVADMAADGFRAADYVLPEVIWIPASDGQMMPGAIVYPRDFDPSRKYPVRMEVYGGPYTSYVRERWLNPSRYEWFAQNGIISITVDGRAAGHGGRAGTDLVYCDLTSVPVQDFSTWAEYLGSLPYVDASRIGVEGYSFGGTMTAMLLLRRHDLFRCGIAGGGVYDWALYDSHYTERFMKTPAQNPDGYRSASVLEAVRSGVGDSLPAGALRLTHGTGDDNVHFLNTLQLASELQERGVQFELMVYPDGMHGYRGAQAAHSDAADREFLGRWLLGR